MNTIEIYRTSEKAIKYQPIDFKKQSEKLQEDVRYLGILQENYVRYDCILQEDYKRYDSILEENSY